MIYKNKLSIFFTILSIIFLIIFFDKFGEYISLEKYIKLSLIVFLFIFFFISIFLNNKIQKKCFFIFIYSVIIIYSLNLLLGLFYIFEDYKKTTLIRSEVTNFDNRNVMEYIKDESSAEKKIYPYLTPREILIKSKNKDFMFVSGLSEQYYAQCNEEGFWKIIRTDKNGFNNILSSSEYNILLAGDSFADGTCSVSEKEIGKQLTQKGFDTYSIGFAGNGPLLTLASIIEREAVLPSERKMISSVFHNRLRDGTTLGADPTVQYAIAEIIPDSVKIWGWWKPGYEITITDLDIDSPYNTRIYPGLPPGPISNPGLASIIAAVEPDKTDYYFFVRDVCADDNSHLFAVTLEEHRTNLSRNEECQ